MISSNRQTYYSVITFAALIITLVECSDRTGQRNPGRTKDEEDMDRYDKPFFIIGSALLLSVAPVFGRFVYSLFTDPVVPLLWKELNERGKEMLMRRFGNLGQHRSEAEGWRGIASMPIRVKYARAWRLSCRWIRSIQFSTAEQCLYI